MRYRIHIPEPDYTGLTYTQKKTFKEYTGYDITAGNTDYDKDTQSLTYWNYDDNTKEYFDWKNGTWEYTGNKAL
jgi:hypothetical protein